MRPPAQFEEGIGVQEAQDAETNMVPMMICTRLAGRAIIRVVDRCNEALENNNLDLSECQLMQVPDAVYHLMRNTELKSCDLSGNVITKIPPKFAVKFSLITDLNLSHNQMSKLPEEIADLGNLERLDISHNSYVGLPNAVFRVPKLTQLIANNNYIIDVEVTKVEAAPSLEIVDLSKNPLSIQTHERLSNLTKVRVTITPREKEDWEDDDL